MGKKMVKKIGGVKIGRRRRRRRKERIVKVR